MAFSGRDVLHDSYIWATRGLRRASHSPVGCPLNDGDGSGAPKSAPRQREWLLLAGVALLAVVHQAAASALRDAHGMAVLGYMPEYRHNGQYNYSQAFAAGLTHVIFFSLEVHPEDLTPAALDRLPPQEILEQARTAAEVHGGKLVMCFGGNARTGGFPKMVLTAETRAKFLLALDELLKEHGFHGVDYNWEYPTSRDEWLGLAALISESRSHLLAGTALVTTAFYPDPRQYNIIKHLELHKSCNFLMSMTYDQPGKHSTFEFAQQTIADWAAHGLPPEKLALGVPFYGRHTKTSEARTYSELHPLLHSKYPRSRSKRDSVDEIDNFYFNGRTMIKKKVRLALEAGLGGVMVWELGQDASTSHPASLMSAVGEAKASGAVRLNDETGNHVEL